MFSLINISKSFNISNIQIFKCKYYKIYINLLYILIISKFIVFYWQRKLLDKSF